MKLVNEAQTSEQFKIRLLSEWIYHLPPKSHRKRLIGNTITIGQTMRWHIECAEDDIQNWKSRGKIPVAATIRRSVVPSVKYRPCNDITQRSKGPIEVGVNKSRMCNRKGSEKHKCAR